MASFKKYFAVVTLATFLALSSTYASGPTQVLVEGMTCAGCAKSIRAALLKHPEVKNVDINVKKGTVTVSFNPEQSLTEEQIREAVKAAGYQVTKVTPTTKSS